MRRLNDYEIADLLAADNVARLSSIDAAGYPHVTPLWFIWTDGAFLLASDAGRPHLLRIRSNPKVGLVIDVEGSERPDGERPNRQVRAIGDATLSSDADGLWTARIWAKYRHDTNGIAESERLQGRQRTLIIIRPQSIAAIASI